MNYEYEYKYKKYKLKYDKLKNIMKGGVIEIDKQISIVKLIVMENLEYFMDLCKLDYEVGGFFDIKKRKYKKTNQGSIKSYRIEGMTLYPFYQMMKIDWHTHQDGEPEIYDEDGKKVKLDHPWISATPSGTDYGTHSGATIHYKKTIDKEEIVISCIISIKGLYFYWMQDELSKFLLLQDNEELQEIIYEYLVPNLDNDMFQGAKNNSIENIQELTKKSFTTPDISCGFNSIFIPIENLQK